jgi:hypothetical protein
MILVGVGAIPPELTHAIMVHQEQRALRLRGPAVITDDNLARGFHPGQQPTDEERNSARVAMAFEWELNRAVGIPKDTRLASFAR